MFEALRARLFQGYRTGKFPPGKPNLPERFVGMPQLDASRCQTDCRECLTKCPSGSLSKDAAGKLTLDGGKCLFCNECEKLCPNHAIKFSNQEYRLGAFDRNALLVTAGGWEVAPNPNHQLVKFCGKSLKIRQVSAGGCGACELDFNVLNTLAWDMGRFGIQSVASPRHADCLLITGPVTDNMQLALQKCYESLPEPKWVIACGACAISGGLYGKSAKTAGGVAELYHVDLYVPGCPPHPATLLEALLRLMGRDF